MRIGFIVEGFKDEKKLKSLFPSIECAVTQGTRFKNRTWMDIDSLISKTDKVYILTDPDPAGDIISNIIQTRYNFERIHINPDKCLFIDNKGNHSHGVEYCNDEYLQNLITLILNPLLNKGDKL